MTILFIAIVLVITLSAPVVSGATSTSNMSPLDQHSADLIIGQDYLIITHDSFYEHILPLATLKQENGYVTNIIKTSDIGINPTADEITTYIRNDYFLADLKTKYLLLVGDAGFIPPHYRTNDGSTYPTDLYYGTMDFNDYLPDIIVGRLPVNNNDELDVMVNKIADFTSISNGALLFGNYPETTYAVGDATILESSDCIVDTAFWNPPSYANTEGQLIVDKINEGRQIVAYYGHGNVTFAGPFGIDEVYQLHNAQLPIFLNGGCNGNKFDSPVKCLGEELVLSSYGAIAFIGSTIHGGYGYTYKFCDGFFAELGNSGVIGTMFDEGRRIAYDAAVAAGTDVGPGSFTAFFFERITLLGDPALRITTNNTSLSGQVDLQARTPKPGSDWVIDATVHLWAVDADRSSASPLATYDITTDDTGVFEIADITAGTYDITLKGSHTLRTLVEDVIITVGAATSVDFGTLTEGDCWGDGGPDNVIDGADYSAILYTFGTYPGHADFVESCDVNQDGVVDGFDYSIILFNFGEAGVEPF